MKYYDLLTQLPCIEPNKNCISDLPFIKWRKKKNPMKVENVADTKTDDENTPVVGDIENVHQDQEQDVSHDQVCDIDVVSEMGDDINL